MEIPSGAEAVSSVSRSCHLGSSKMAVWLCFVVLSVVCGYGVNAQNTPHGVELMLNQKVLDLAAQVGLDLLFNDLATHQIPDFSGTGSHHLAYKISNIRLKSVGKPNHSVGLQNGRVNLAVTGASLSASADWEFTAKVAFIPVKSRGSMDVSVRSLSMNAQLHFAMGGLRSPQIVLDENSASASGVSVDIHRSILSFIYNLFKKKTAQLMSAAIEGALEKLVVRSIDKYNAKMASQPTFVKLGDDLVLNFTLTDNPTVVKGRITLPIDGSVTLTKKAVTIPRTHGLVEFALHNISTDKDVCIGISSHPLDTLFTTLIHEVGTALNITTDMLPKEVQNYACLDNDILHALLGDPAKLPYDGCLKVEVRLVDHISSAIGQGVVSLATNVDLRFYQEFKGKEAFLFNLMTNVSMVGLPKVKNESIVLEPQHAKINFTTGQSRVGNINARSLTGLANTQITTYLKKYAKEIELLNVYAFPLPKIPGTVYLEDKELSVEQGKVVVCTDVKVDFN